MFRSLVFHISVVVVIIIIAKRTLSLRRNTPPRIRLRHYVFLSFLAVMNVSGLSQASWSLGRLLEGNMIARMEQHFVAFRELPAVLALMVWGYGVIGKCITTFLITGLARSNGRSRAVLLKMFPLLVLAQGAASFINMRGPDELAFVQSRSTEYLIAFCFWCLFAWPYIFAYQFYRGTACDILFTALGAEHGESDGHAS